MIHSIINTKTFLLTISAIGHIAEAISEHVSNVKGTESANENFVDENYHAELAIAYNVLLQQWLPNREPKVCSEILHALSFIYPLLPQEKLIEQVPKVIPQLQGFYRFNFISRYNVCNYN